MYIHVLQFNRQFVLFGFLFLFLFLERIALNHPSKIILIMLYSIRGSALAALRKERKAYAGIERRPKKKKKRKGGSLLTWLPIACAYVPYMHYILKFLGKGKYVIARKKGKAEKGCLQSTTP